MYDNAVAQKTFRGFKTQLTRAINAKDPNKVLAECRRFRDYYASSAEPMPDFWSRWQRAADDAFFDLRRQGKDAARVEIA